MTNYEHVAAIQRATAAAASRAVRHDTERTQNHVEMVHWAMGEQAKAIGSLFMGSVNSFPACGTEIDAIAHTARFSRLSWYVLP